MKNIVLMGGCLWAFLKMLDGKLIWFDINFNKIIWSFEFDLWKW